MYCRMIRGAYIRANGEMACYCGPGEAVSLGRIPYNNNQYDFVKDFYYNENHQRIRKNYANNILPYPSVCLKCLYLEPLLPDQFHLVNTEIEWMHFEATSLCNLDCPFCIPHNERKIFRQKPHFIPFGMFRKIVDDVARNEMSVKWMYFSGRGEPGLHDKTWDMVGYAKKHLETNFLVNTNGNIEFSDKIVESGLDKIKIAVDGSDQNSYQVYRRRGKLDRILKLTRRITEHKISTGRNNPKIIWQYILFDHNADETSLIDFQKTAMDLGVDEILFKTTFTHHYASETLDSIPRIHPNIAFVDIKEMVSVSLRALDEKFIRLNALEQNKDCEKMIPLGIEIAKKIFLSFIMGIERKQLYNQFAKSDDTTMMIALAKNDDQEYEPLLSRLRLCFQKLATAYKHTGNGHACEFYIKFDRKLDEGRISVCDIKELVAA